MSVYPIYHLFFLWHFANANVWFITTNLSRVYLSTWLSQFTDWNQILICHSEDIWHLPFDSTESQVLFPHSPTFSYIVSSFSFCCNQKLSESAFEFFVKIYLYNKGFADINRTWYCTQIIYNTGRPKLLKCTPDTMLN